MTADASGSNGFRAVVATINELPVARSIVGGVGAFASGYALFATLVAATGSVSADSLLTALKQLGFLFYNAHDVPLVRRQELVQTVNQTDPETGEIVNATDVSVTQESFNLLLQSDPSLPTAVYFAVPIVALLVVAGWLVVTQVDPTDARTGGAVILGTTVGYVLASGLGTFLAVLRATEGTSSETIAPSRPLALAFGAAYPFVVTTILVLGVAGYYRYRQRTGESSAE